MSLPSGFVPLNAAASAGDGSSFLGMISEIRGPFKIKDNSWAIEFTIQDGQGELACSTQRKVLEHLPKPPGVVGDAAIARCMMLQKRGGKTWAVTAARLKSDILFIPAKNIPIPELSAGYGPGGFSKMGCSGSYCAQLPTPQEQRAIVQVKAAVAQSLAQKPAVSLPPKRPNANPPPKYKKQAPIKDMVIGNFYNLVGEVVKMYYPDYSTMDLYITDYTENQDLFLYEDPDDEDTLGYPTERKWPGPFGQMTIAIRLWEPHASFVRTNIKEGDIVFLQNVKAKLSQSNKLEGSIQQDQRYPDKICAHKCMQAGQIAELQKRKADYNERCEAQKASRMIAAQNVPKKASAKASAKKKEQKKEQQRLEKEQEQKELEKIAEELAIAKAGINPHVRAGHPEIQLSTISEIIHNPKLKTKGSKNKDITLPFINCKYRARVRIVDCHPPKLHMFARELSDPKWNPEFVKKYEDRLKGRFEWGFILLVEDADVEVEPGKKPAQLRLIIGNEAGQHLLKMNASDLQKDPAALKKLEEKLFILWGNMFELKTELLAKGINISSLPRDDPRAKLQNMPFEVCIEEYGVPIGKKTPGDPACWQRNHQAFATTIMD